MPEDRSGRHEPDDTREFSPFADDEPAAGPEPAVDPSGAEVGPDGGPRSGGPSAADATQISADRTAMMPRSDAPDPGRAEAAARAAAGPAAPDWETRSQSAWAGRAEVRASRPGAGGDYTPTDWAPADTEPRRVWWSPILIGILTLLLVVLLGVGIWLIAGSVQDDGTPAPATTAVPATSEVTTAATSVAPTTKAPTKPSATPASVPIPALKGLSSQQARQALDRVGLAYRLKFLPSDAEPGTVVDSDPAEGQEVPADTEVTLFLATRPSPVTNGTSATPLGADEPVE